MSQPHFKIQSKENLWKLKKRLRFQLVMFVYNASKLAANRIKVAIEQQSLQVA